jgi:hypothetical protein
MKGSSGVIRGFMRNEGISSSATGAAALTDALPWALVGDAAAALCGDGADIGTAPTSLYLKFAAVHMGHTSPDSFELADGVEIHEILRRFTTEALKQACEALLAAIYTHPQDNHSTEPTLM